MAPPSKSNHADTAHRSHDLHDGPPEPPPPYTCAAAPPAAMLLGKSPLRVAMLPPRRPSKGHVYLNEMIYFARHEHLRIQGSHGLRKVPLFFYHLFKSAGRQVSAGEKPRYTDETETILVFSPLDSLGPGEVDIPIGPGYVWTREWEFMLTVRSESERNAGQVWQADICLYFHGLSPHGDVTIPWKDPSKTRSVGRDAVPRKHINYRYKGKNWLKFTWKFHEAALYPRWGASINIYYIPTRDSTKGGIHEGPPAAFHNPWTLLNPTSTTQ